MFCLNTNAKIERIKVSYKEKKHPRYKNGFLSIARNKRNCLFAVSYKTLWEILMTNYDCVNYGFTVYLNMYFFYFHFILLSFFIFGIFLFKIFSGCIFLSFG